VEWTCPDLRTAGKEPACRTRCAMPAIIRLHLLDGWSGLGRGVMASTACRRRIRDWCPCLDIINPPLWELGHVAWFMEYWCRRYRGAGATAPLPVSPCRRRPLVRLAPCATRLAAGSSICPTGDATRRYLQETRWPRRWRPCPAAAPHQCRALLPPPCAVPRRHARRSLPLHAARPWPGRRSDGLADHACSRAMSRSTAWVNSRWAVRPRTRASFSTTRSGPTRKWYRPSLSLPRRRETPTTRPSSTPAATTRRSGGQLRGWPGSRRPARPCRATGADSRSLAAAALHDLGGPRT
jgi:hypothetical protein